MQLSMPEKVKPGDRVRIVNHVRLDGRSRTGRTGTVARISSVDGYAYVHLDRTPRERTDKTELFAFDEMEVLSAEVRETTP